VLILTLDEIRARIDDAAVIDRMRDALLAQSRGECETPMPMHLHPGKGSNQGEVHVKSSYRHGGKYFVLKVATTFRGASNGMMMLASAETGEPVVYLADSGHLTDVRTAAVSAMVARALGRQDRAIGILGTGIQARLTARFHAHALPLERVYIWGRNRERALHCAEDVRQYVPEAEVFSTPSAVAEASRLIVTCTASRSPLLSASDVRAGTHITAVGADSEGKQELDPEILSRSGLLLVDSAAQCEKLGELQHARDQIARAVEIGTFLERPKPADNSVADLTGLGVEDLFIAESIYENRNV